MLSLICAAAVSHWALTQEASNLFESPCYVPVVFIGAAVVYVVVADRRDRAEARRHRPRGVHCESCGYELGNLAVCPECGARYRYLKSSNRASGNTNEHE